MHQDFLRTTQPVSSVCSIEHMLIYKLLEMSLSVTISPFSQALWVLYLNTKPTSQQIVVKLCQCCSAINPAFECVPTIGIMTYFGHCSCAMGIALSQSFIDVVHCFLGEFFYAMFLMFASLFIVCLWPAEREVCCPCLCSGVQKVFSSSFSLYLTWWASLVIYSSFSLSVSLSVSPSLSLSVSLSVPFSLFLSLSLSFPPSLPPSHSVPGPVTISDVNRLNGTHMTVTWVPLTLEEARGFITHYTIIAIPTNEVRKRQDNGTISYNFSSSASSGTLGGLSTGVEYDVIVIGNTVAGAGQQNPAILVPTVTTPTAG